MKLREIAHSRTGDKGNTSNIGVIARLPLFLSVIRDQVEGAAGLVDERLGETVVQIENASTLMDHSPWRPR